jgi:hypothetical protein
MADRGATLAQLRDLVERARPVVPAHERTLPVLPALSPLLPGGTLRRGQVVAVEGGAGATTLVLALIAGPTRAGWGGAGVGASVRGWAPAPDVGVDLARTVAVRPPERTWAEVVAALVDAFDVVVCGPDHAPAAAETRRLARRARERGAVVVSLGDARPGRTSVRRGWGEPDVRWSVAGARWHGPGCGWGHLRTRRVTVAATGRGELGRPRRVDLWLPGPSGVTLAEADPAPVVPLHPGGRPARAGTGAG